MNLGLTAAREAKKDEFYTQYVDIQKEVEAYLEFDPDTFRNKTVYCNCDDPFESNFFKYFAANFDRLGLRKLITTSFDGSSIAGAQITFDEYTAGNGIRPKPKAICVEIDEVTDVDGNGAVGIEDVKLFLEKNPHSHRPLEGGGDFRSPECIELLQEADIVVTNPPFSLFKEFMALMTKYEKKLLVIGNLQALTYKTIFPLIKADKLWMGVTIHSGDREFRVPDHYPLNASGYRTDENGNKYIRVKGVRWYTNLDHGRRHQVLPLMPMKDNLRFNKKISGKSVYERYENYDAIEVSFTDAIPSDYDGVMGVPITFLDKYNPDQFEILGTLDSSDPDNPCRTRWYSAQDQKDAYFRRFGKPGSIPLNMSGVINDTKVYKRILIRHRR
ncbi:adenine-specific methyltransferase EcoRI family protein [Yoonia vestfoldensis]|uniref:Adenine-specific methyltransferase EcoRI n=1 Tax=Yoonia vestfoldensis TaxID=245188 RepID=A0A1Y0E9M7_9RHOB|nr:adenine-specific methyltransferase EcoRI family protein [Yoonia vestfoldensis]ARU00208.1 adenine-specific methyltransferase EcoRI [Yoonia vestfoldensis]